MLITHNLYFCYNSENFIAAKKKKKKIVNYFEMFDPVSFHLWLFLNVCLNQTEL